MKTKSINYISYPLIIISITLCISGVRWLLSSEPWMLDQVANEERLQMTFENLFIIDGNSTLSTYLMQIYRFLGLYVLGIGFLLLSFTPKKFMEIHMVRQRVLIVLSILLVSNLDDRLCLDSFITFYLCDVGSNYFMFYKFVLSF